MRSLFVVIGLVLCLPTGMVMAQAKSDSTYTVRSGDTLFSIAREHGVSVRALRRWNDLDDSTLQEGQTLRVRPPAGPTPKETRPPPPDTVWEPDTTRPAREASTDSTQRPFGQHVVEDGETFITLALRLGTTADTLWALNESQRDSLSAGDVIRLPRRFGPPTHVVEEGETLYSIAGQYGASVRSLQAVNDLDTTSLQPGQHLRLPMRSSTLNAPGTWAEPDTTGPASVYPESFTGRLMASGRTYDPDAFVVSHPTLPFGSVVLVSTANDQQSTFARVLDRGPVEENLLLDLSTAVAEQLGVEADTTPTVALRVVWIAE